MMMPEVSQLMTRLIPEASRFETTIMMIPEVSRWGTTMHGDGVGVNRCCCDGGSDWAWSKRTKMVFVVPTTSLARFGGLVLAWRET